MSAPSPPPDNSMAVEQMRQDAATKERERVAQEAAAHKAELAGLRTSARGSATGSVNDFFLGKGVDPEQYSGSIASQLNNMLNAISPTDENPGAAFSGAGASIWDTLQTGERTRAQSGLDRLFAPNFETQRAAFNLDDPYIKAFENEQFSDADAIIKNMLDRGVLTTSGYNTALKDLENQRAGVHSRIEGVGTDLITKEQGALRDIANRGRQAAGNLQLGMKFDPFTYGSEADQSFNDFIAGLSGNLKAGLPGKLFNTAGLAAVGGAGQGAGNTAFNPQAAAGTIEDKDEAGNALTTTGKNPNSIF